MSKKKIEKWIAYILALAVGMTNITTVSAAETPVMDTAGESDEKVPVEYTEGDFSYHRFVDGTAGIFKYNGKGGEVIIPETVGENIKVTELDQSLFYGNELVEKVFIPKYVDYMGETGAESIFMGASSLKEISVDAENTSHFSRDGILFSDGYKRNQRVLVKYPEGRETADGTYRIPEDVDFLWASAFCHQQKLKKIVIPETVKDVGECTFTSFKDSMIVFCHNKASDLGSFAYTRAFAGLENVDIIVKNEEMRTALMEGFDAESNQNTTIKTVAELTEAEKAETLTPAESLTFNDGSVVKNVQVTPDELGNILSDLDEQKNPREGNSDMFGICTAGCWQEISYTLLPETTTDVLTWTSSDPSVARVASFNGQDTTLYGLKEGTCTITGSDESGHSLTLNVTVSKNSGTTTTDQGQTEVKEETSKEIKPSPQEITGVETSYKKACGTSFTLKPKAKTVCNYSTGNAKVAGVDSSGKVTLKGTGKTTITITAQGTSKYQKAVKKVTIYSVPAKMKVPVLKVGKKKAAVSWKKNKGADVYQIQYSTNSKFKKAKSLNCSGKTTKAAIKKLKSGKKYYVRIRAYKKIDDKKYYGSYSKVKSVKIK